MEKLRKEIGLCSDLTNTIYTSIPFKYTYSTEIIRYHNAVIKMYMGQYFYGKKILDIGSGPLSELKFYSGIKIPLVIGIEPSKFSIDKALKKYSDDKLFTQYKLIEGYGDEIWKNNKKDQSMCNYFRTKFKN